MNLQSDFGYPVGKIQIRNYQVCVKWALYCRNYAHRYRDNPEWMARFRQHARDWITEARWYKQRETPNHLCPELFDAKDDTP